MTVLHAGPPRDQVTARRIVEALRSGVPSRDAVAALGTGQSAAEDRVLGLLGGSGDAAGVLLGGDFGSGKTHLLEHLAALAADQGWVVSRIVVSKETPLHDPVKVQRAAVATATLPAGTLGEAVAETAADIDVTEPGYADLLRWAGSALDERFVTSLSLFARVRESETDIADTLVRFWSGEPVKVTDLRRWAKEHGDPRPDLGSISVRDLARQRMRFLARLFAASGRTGWLLLFDEVELIGRYGLASRGKSYAEIAGLVRPEPEVADAPVRSVLALTDDFSAAVLAKTGKGDRDKVPDQLRGKATPEADILRGRAELGMRLLDRELLRLDPPRDEDLAEAYRTLRRLHGEAFHWDPPDVPGLERLGTTRMRQYVRAWINEWDLVRLNPDYSPDTVTRQVGSSYAEDPDLGDTPENA
jgi:hypothetical protein